jgi:hypothetical protein
MQARRLPLRFSSRQPLDLHQGAQWARSAKAVLGRCAIWPGKAAQKGWRHSGKPRLRPGAPQFWLTRSSGGGTEFRRGGEGR